MDELTAGDLVRVESKGPDLDGIVFDIPNHNKVVVAVVDPARGPSFRTVHPAALSERGEEGPSDRALHLLIRRTPPSLRGGAGGGGAGGRGRSGFSRGTAHRPTGK